MTRATRLLALAVAAALAALAGACASEKMAAAQFEYISIGRPDGRPDPAHRPDPVAVGTEKVGS